MGASTRENKPGDIDINALFEAERLVKAGRLESAQDFRNQTKTVPDRRMIGNRIAALKNSAKATRASGEIRKACRLERRAKALEIFKDHGLDPDKLIAITDLHDEYEGKILLVSISAGRARGVVCLRSGDDWHREILRNTEEEIKDLGFDSPVVVPVGGAAIRSDRNGNVVIFGSSDEYGTCDKKIAANLIEKAFPGKTVLVHR